MVVPCDNRVQANRVWGKNKRERIESKINTDGILIKARLGSAALINGCQRKSVNVKTNVYVLLNGTREIHDYRILLKKKTSTAVRTVVTRHC